MNVIYVSQKIICKLQCIQIRFMWKEIIPIDPKYAYIFVNPVPWRVMETVRSVLISLLTKIVTKILIQLRFYYFRAVQGI